MSTNDDSIAGLGPRGQKPVLNASAQLRDAKLSPTEGFVLSRVDGQTSYAEICSLTGLGAVGTIEILQRLKFLGFILNPGESASASPVPAATSPTEARPRRHSTVGGQDSVLVRLDDNSPVDPADLVDGPDLDPLVKKRLIRAARRMAKLAPHEILGVPQNADAKTIKKAYVLATKELHPDRFYGKNLGIFRGLLERLFRGVSEAFAAMEKPRG